MHETRTFVHTLMLSRHEYYVTYPGLITDHTRPLAQLTDSPHRNDCHVVCTVDDGEKGGK